MRKARLGAIGHSLGAHNAIYTAVFDPRIQVSFRAAASILTLITTMATPPTGSSMARLVPDPLHAPAGRLSRAAAGHSLRLSRIDWRAGARDPSLNAPLRDSNFRSQSVDQVVNAACRRSDRPNGVPQNLRVEHPDCEHDFPLEVRDAAYRFLDQHLR